MYKLTIGENQISSIPFLIYTLKKVFLNPISIPIKGVSITAGFFLYYPISIKIRFLMKGCWKYRCNMRKTTKKLIPCTNQSNLQRSGKLCSAKITLTVEMIVQHCTEKFYIGTEKL